MGLLRLAVLGSPEVFHHGSRLTFPLRKAQALLLYLAVEGGMHSRSKLAGFLWPDSEPHDARTALRNAIALLRNLLTTADTATQHTHLISERDLLGLDPQAQMELDLDVVERAWQQIHLLSTAPTPQRRAALVAQVQDALSLVRGPFLDGFWLREETAFDEWHTQQQQQWQVRLQFLFERLSVWQEEAGEWEQAIVTLTRWLALDPLAEEAYRRVMRVHLTLGDPTAAWQVYATCKARLAEALQVKPSQETVALAKRIRATTVNSALHPPPSPHQAESRPLGELVAPLIGRAAAFSQLVGSFQQARQGQAQAVLVIGEAGIGKTRLATEFVAWTRAQGAEVLSGHAFEMAGRLPYQPLVEALRPRLEEENAPEDLLDDLWLAELARLLPELRVRYPDLPTPTQDEQAARSRLFEAMTRLMSALAQRAPLVLLLDDLQWVDEASLDLLRYLGHSWRHHGSRVLLLCTLRSEGLAIFPHLSAQLADLGRDIPVAQVALETLSQAQTRQLMKSFVGSAEPGTRSESGESQPGTARSSHARPAVSSPQKLETQVDALSDFLFAQTGGQPFYLLEMLKMLRDQRWLVFWQQTDGTWRLEFVRDIVAAIRRGGSRRPLLPTSVRTMIQARLAKLSPTARQMVMASAVLNQQASAKLLLQLADLEIQVGIEALEEAVSSGLLCEGGTVASRPGSYRFAHDLMRDVIYTEMGEARRRILHQRALVLLQATGARASDLAYHARASGEVETAYRYSVQAGDEAMALFAVADAIVSYEQARTLFQEHIQQAALDLYQAKSLPLITVQDLADRTRANPTSFPEVEHLYVNLGRAYAFQNAWQQAQEAYEELLAYGQLQHLPALVSMTLNRLAVLAVHQSLEKPRVQALLEEARHTAEASHDQRVLAETAWNQAQIIAILWEDRKQALAHAEQALSLAQASNDRELQARSLATLGLIHHLGGDFEQAIHAVEASLALYATLGDEPMATQELSLPHLLVGAPLTQRLTNRASEAMCWQMLAMAKLQQGHVQSGIDHGRRALALAKEIKNVWVQVVSTATLTHGLLEAGAYEEALLLTQHTLALAQTLEYRVIFHILPIALGSAYQALQQWEEARSTLEEVAALGEQADLGILQVFSMSLLCMNDAVTGAWEAAHRSALKAIALRKRSHAALITMDFYRHYETEALLRGGDERQAREEVQRLGEHLGPYSRFRIPYLRSRAVLATWDGEREQAIEYLCEAAQVAADLDLPTERWQIQALLASLYEAQGKPEQARAAFSEAATIIKRLAEGIKDEALCARFLAAPQIQQILQQAQSEALQAPYGK